MPSDVSKLKTSELLVQLMSAGLIGSLAMQTGFIMAWPSSNVANFRSNETVLGTPMTSLHISLLGALPSSGALLGLPICSWAFDTLGRKYATILFSLPYVFSWLIISLTNNITLILIAITMAGVAIACQNISVIYISEIAHPSIRGTMTSCVSIGYLTGILISYIMGGYLKYMTVVLVHLTMSILTISLIAFLPESPVFLVMVGKEEQAAKALSFYRHLDVYSKEVADEIVRIRKTINPKLEILLQEKEDDPETADKLIDKVESNNKKEHLSAWRYLLASKSTKRILAIILTIIAVTILMGGCVLDVYAELLFAAATPTMSANLCAILLAVDSLTASVLSMCMIDKYGRKFILMTSSLTAGICTGILGIQLKFHLAPNWFTAALIYVYDFVYTGGCAVIPTVLSSEVFLPEVRSICNSFCYVFLWIFSFINLFIFNPLVESMGLGFVFFIFCFMCVTGAIFIHFFLPETEGLPVDVIQVRFLKQSGFKRRK